MAQCDTPNCSAPPLKPGEFITCFCWHKKENESLDDDETPPTPKRNQNLSVLKNLICCWLGLNQSLTEQLKCY